MNSQLSVSEAWKLLEDFPFSSSHRNSFQAILKRFDFSESFVTDHNTKPSEWLLHLNADARRQYDKIEQDAQKREHKFSVVHSKQYQQLTELIRREKEKQQNRAAVTDAGLAIVRFCLRQQLLANETLYDPQVSPMPIRYDGIAEDLQLLDLLERNSQAEEYDEERGNVIRFDVLTRNISSTRQFLADNLPEHQKDQIYKIIMDNR